MTDKLCATCGERPRHVSKGGKTLAYCQSCAQKRWRAYKKPTPKGTPTKRKAKTNQPAAAHRTPAAAPAPVSVSCWLCGRDMATAIALSHLNIWCSACRPAVLEIQIKTSARVMALITRVRK